MPVIFKFFCLQIFCVERPHWFHIHVLYQFVHVGHLLKLQRAIRFALNFQHNTFETNRGACLHRKYVFVPKTTKRQFTLTVSSDCWTWDSRITPRKKAQQTRLLIEERKRSARNAQLSDCLCSDVKHATLVRYFLVVTKSNPAAPAAASELEQI